jgi:hypothetical protein
MSLALVARVALALGADVTMGGSVDVTTRGSVDQIWLRAAAVSAAELVLLLCAAGESAEQPCIRRLHACMRACVPAGSGASLL